MNTLKSLRRAGLFVAVLAFRCATASNRYQRVAVTADPPDAVVTASAIVGHQLGFSIAGPERSIHRPSAICVTLRPRE
jgi:hypothetical protein